MAALQGGSQQIYCSWGIPQSDGGVDLGLAAISDQTAADLTSALRDSVYVELDAIGEEVVFDQGPSSEHRYLDTIIIGDGLLVVSTGTLQGNFARDAWDLVTGRTE
ncbi:hypothetical protein JOF28_000378 [Leucobacter exalbidus]|uniref:Uncharacterized protein n=1 Tax=Leucobacter exalbidus TaxID=662960 RepID=A0A940PTX2_9MICO|nr:hypothetical protein [Leucobacter exalbidus]MBP1325146.1 hypothetical protein [Leucobacter exalbidus]